MDTDKEDRKWCANRSNSNLSCSDALAGCDDAEKLEVLLEFPSADRRPSTKHYIIVACDHDTSASHQMP
jgi:hypothetical protein